MLSNLSLILVPMEQKLPCHFTPKGIVQSIPDKVGGSLREEEYQQVCLACESEITKPFRAADMPIGTLFLWT